MRLSADVRAGVVAAREPAFVLRTVTTVDVLGASALLMVLLMALPVSSAAQAGASSALLSAASAPASGSLPHQGQAAYPVPQSKSKTAVNANATVAREHRWRDLTESQKTALKSLEADWDGLDAPRRQKWVQLADRLPTMQPAEQARIQARMAYWSKLTPQQRGQTRLNFLEATQLPSNDRQARWDAYQALPPEQKREFAARAGQEAPVAASGSARKADQPDSRISRPQMSGPELSQSKSNIVPNPAFANRPNAISPTVLRASPGATTTVISKLPAPPSHQQAGMPKIAGTPTFVDKTTLLPLRGPQGAANHPDPASGARGATRP